MTAYNQNVAYTKAIEIVAAGLQSNSIKLNGAGNSNVNAQNIKLDSEYINGLINAIVKNISAE
ncbi:MAG: hypothetical protein WC810_01065 [Janthinobacterium sp.]|jgi:hypothetical protein